MTQLPSQNFPLKPRLAARGYGFNARAGSAHRSRPPERGGQESRMSTGRHRRAGVAASKSGGWRRRERTVSSAVACPGCNTLRPAALLIVVGSRQLGNLGLCSRAYEVTSLHRFVHAHCSSPQSSNE
ncbi:hypothetical protein C8T65DRAFT_115410 [Cerioporus squamosus]|nr:hypothetical protein C8T65DRAFT_115410 [Cerioporus squamosus]